LFAILCLNLNGDWINAGGGANGKINPLQIRPAPRDSEDEPDEKGGKLYRDEGNGMSDMALHVKNLEIFFNLYLPSLTDMQKVILKQSVIELYNRFGIYWNTDITTLSNTQFPTFSDLHKLISEKAEKDSNNPDYRDLALLLYDVANGSDSFLWNGHTAVETHSRCICLDTHSLQNTSENIKRTQYFIC